MRTIKLNEYGLGRYDDVSPFLITDNKLEVKIELAQVNGDFYLITKNNGSTEKHYLSSDGKVEINNLTAGELKAEVKHYLKGTLIKCYKVEPLLLIEADGELSGVPELVYLNNKIAALNKSLEAETEINTALGKRIALLEKNVIALCRFAFADFNENVYLGGGSFKDFKNKFGIDLTKEEISEIKGEQNNEEN